MARCTEAACRDSRDWRHSSTLTVYCQHKCMRESVPMIFWQKCKNKDCSQDVNSSGGHWGIHILVDKDLFTGSLPVLRNAL